jgi:hypothetical protein
MTTYRDAEITMYYGDRGSDSDKCKVIKQNNRLVISIGTRVFEGHDVDGQYTLSDRSSTIRSGARVSFWKHGDPAIIGLWRHGEDVVGTFTIRLGDPS